MKNLEHKKVGAPAAFGLATRLGFRPYERRSSSNARAQRRTGFTLIEVMIALSILGLIVANVSLVMRTSASSAEAGVRINQLENQAGSTMDRIANAIMASSSDGITPAPAAPDSERYLDFKRNVGIEDGAIIWGNDERISLDEDTGQVVWIENRDSEAERRIVWSNWVSNYLEGELPNGEDDNDNGLEDETGLSFDMEGRKVTIRLTLSQTAPEGREYSKTLVTRVTARN